MKYEKKLVLFTLFAMNLVDQPAPEVQIEQGILSGIVSPDGAILEYIGIPYATTNSDTRFKPPLPGPSWEGVFKATRTVTCPSPTPWGSVSGQEDCLRMNVYVPALESRPLPVMVFVHGGAFYLGDGGKLMYGPEFIVAQGVILVTFNYRLGVLGFTSLHVPEAPGNVGLRDQVFALRWVRRNIASFGGDPDNITLFGQSAGGASVSFLLASPATQGLYHRAIVQSGSALSSWALDRDPVSTASLIARELGYNTTDPQELYDIFTTIPYQDLVGARPRRPLDKFMDTELLHLPCIEKTYEGLEPVINDLPYNLLRNKKTEIPLIYGSTSKEGLFLINLNQQEYFENVKTKYVFASDLKFTTVEEAEATDKRVRHHYFNGENIGMSHLMNVSEMMTDMYFEKPMLLESTLVLKQTNSPIWHYQFDYDGGRNFLKYFTGNQARSGACHGDELLYLFKARLWPLFINQRDWKMIHTITRLWTNFAKYGDPTPSFLEDTSVRWPHSSPDQLRFLYINEDLRVGPMPNPHTFQLWKDIYDNYRNMDVN